MIYWGIVSRGHDASITVTRDEEILFAAHAERYSGVKNDANINQKLVEAARQYGEPQHVVWYEKPWLKATRHLYAGQPLNDLKIRKHLDEMGITAPYSTVGHHESHAAGGYWTSGFQDASILVVDAIGEWDTMTIWEASGRSMKKVHSTKYPHSLGLLYSAFTQRLGLKPNEEEYIMMGMAALGTPRFVDRIHQDFIKEHDGLGIQLKVNVHRGIKDWCPGLTTTQDHYDIAASIQAITEEFLIDTTQWMRDHLPSKNLVISGGVALNCKANTEIAKYARYDNIWIMPNPGDAGSSMGAIAAYRKDHLNWQTPYLGTNIEGELKIDEVIHDLLNGGVVGIAKGRAEWGPRSLGNRALITDPRGPDAKDRVNEIKRRQPFRPFAPMILEEMASDIFEMPYRTTPYMQFTAKCKHPDLYPAICHYDDTSRVQTVNREQNPMIHELLTRWYQDTGCPLLLNTSLNIKGQPLVDNWEDAMKFWEMYGIKIY